MARDARIPACVLVIRKRPMKPGDIVYVPKTKVVMGFVRECWFDKGQFIVLVQQSNVVARRRRDTCE